MATIMGIDDEPFHPRPPARGPETDQDTRLSKDGREALILPEA